MRQGKPEQAPVSLDEAIGKLHWTVPYTLVESFQLGAVVIVPATG